MFAAQDNVFFAWMRRAEFAGIIVKRFKAKRLFVCTARRLEAALFSGRRVGLHPDNEHLIASFFCLSSKLGSFDAHGASAINQKGFSGF